jgi:hypothetical protein
MCYMSHVTCCATLFRGLVGSLSWSTCRKPSPGEQALPVICYMLHLVMPVSSEGCSLLVGSMSWTTCRKLSPGQQALCVFVCMRYMLHVINSVHRGLYRWVA